MSAGPFSPELGQLAFGQPNQQFKCPYSLEAAVEFMSNAYADQFPSRGNPFSNDGKAAESPNFMVEAYHWGSYDQLWNLFHKPTGLRVSWYKYAGRGMSVDRDVSVADTVRLVRDFLDDLPLFEERESGASLVEDGVVKWLSASET